MKEKYIKMRNAQKLDNQWLWEYYKQEGGKLNNPQEFIKHFYNIVETINVGGEIFEQKMKRDLSSFFSDMDRKFELQTLWNSDGSFIKVVE